MTGQTTRLTGQSGEAYVCGELKKRNMRIVARNVREKFAEIDIVAVDGDTLCFIEVRTRKNTSLGHPAETITAKKKRAIRRAAEAYLVRHRIPPRPIRFDVATLVWDTMTYEYFENAF
ncbi:MAG: YraN family protein [Myxococcota bacterium]|nr:YraN family protein [Myxococcota bacterium]